MDVGGATFGYGAKTPGHDEARDDRAKTSKRRPQSEDLRAKCLRRRPQSSDAMINFCPSQPRRVDSEEARTKGNQTEEGRRTRPAKAMPVTP